MKRSELQEYIKEQITDMLSEASKEEIDNTKELTQAVKDLGDAKKEAGLSEDEDAEAPAGDKEMNKKASKNDKIINNFRRIKKQMDTHLEMFKSAEGEKAKKAAKQMLKNLTPEYQAAKKAYDQIK